MNYKDIDNRYGISGIISTADSHLKIAIIHDWLISCGGAEKVLEQLLLCFPRAHVYTLLHKINSQSPIIESRQVTTSFLQKIPIKDHRKLIALMPIAIEQFDLSDYDIIISNTFAVAHGIISKPSQYHLTYVNRTMRYAWDTYHDDLKAFGIGSGAKRAAASIGYHYLRLWDYAAFQRPDDVICNSSFSSQRVKKYYHRSSNIIRPPVETDDFYISSNREDYYVTVGRLVPLKGIDIMVSAFNKTGRSLVIIGDGPQYKDLKEKAGKNIKFMGHLQTPDIAQILSRARAYIAMSEEDFGIANVEAFSSGLPVIAWNSGGIASIVNHGDQGWLFNERSEEGLNIAITEFENREHLFWEAQSIAQFAEQFSSQKFRQNIMRHIAIGIQKA